MNSYEVTIMIPVEGRSWAEKHIEIEARNAPHAIAKVCRQDAEYSAHNVKQVKLLEETDE